MAVAVILFIFAGIHQSSEHSEQISSAFSSITSATSKVWPLKIEKTFYEVAKEQGTNKVTFHSYHELYHKNLPYLPNKRIKMLEIGPGCHMVSQYQAPAQNPGKNLLDYFRGTALEHRTPYLARIFSPR